MDFNRDWGFVKSASEWPDDFEAQGLALEAVILPHTWNADDMAAGSRAPCVGSGGYRKTFTGPALASGQRLLLEFEGANNGHKVWVNGGYAGGRNGGFLPTPMDIADFLQAGGNTVLVRADNRYDPLAAIPRHMDWNRYGGITRPVWMHIREHAYLTCAGIEKGQTMGTRALCMLLRGALLAAVGMANLTKAADMKAFNVIEYGAKGDDQTDNTAAFSACMKAVVEAGGGRMVIPDGVYRGRIVIPPVSKPMPSWITVEIVGESEPTPVFGTIGDFPLRNQGTILKCLEKTGPAVIEAAPATSQSLYGGFSGINVALKNLDIRTYDNPGISGVDLQHALQCKIENVFINTGVYNVQASKPTHATHGLVTPRVNNAAWTVLRNVVVTGYHNGIVANEHTDADNIVVASNINGIRFDPAHHASRFARVGTYRNTHHILVNGAHGFTIEQMNTERPGPNQTHAGNEWQTLVADVHDPRNLGIGEITYWVVIGNVGARDEFVKDGGANIRTRRIGAAGGNP